MTTTSKTKLLTDDDLMRLDALGVRGELIRGVLHRTGLLLPKYENPRLNLERELGDFVEGEQSGVLLLNAGVWLESKPDTVRKADIAYLSNDSVQAGALKHGYPEAAPSLLVDFVGPADILEDVTRNALMWSAHGVALVWIAYLGGRSVDVYQAGAPVITLTEDDHIDGGDVLLGFSCRVSDIFHQ